MEDLATFMKQLSYEMELPSPLQPENTGTYVLPIEENVNISISQTESGISLSSEFSDCPTIKREQFLSDMLVGNLFGQGTSHAVLGLNTTGKKLTLRRDLNHDINYRDFIEFLEDFINTIDFWRQESIIFK